MSYSRWSNSHWYTYYLAYPSYRLDEQRFEICGLYTFRYRELKDDIDKCLEKVRQEDTSATDEQMDELRRYMEIFISDVEHDLQICYYEQLLQGDISHLDEILKYVEEYKDDDFGKEIKDAIKVIQCEYKDLPLLIDIHTDLGKICLERRLKTGS